MRIVRTSQCGHIPALLRGLVLALGVIGVNSGPAMVQEVVRTPMVGDPDGSGTTGWTPAATGFEVPGVVPLTDAGVDETRLADRVGELEEALQEMKDKEAAAKKKAAGRPSVTAGGRIMVDWATFNQNGPSRVQAGDMFNGTEFRRARIFLKGDAFDVIDYKIMVDFAGQTAFKDVYMTVKELPLLGSIRAGHFKEPWSLEQRTSSKFITFMERGVNHVFSPERNTGVMVFDRLESENVTWAIGAFTTLIEEDPPEFTFNDYDDAGGTSLTMRGTFLPWYDEATDGRGMIHTGVSYSYRDIPELVPGGANRFRLRELPDESHLAPPVVDTGWLDDADSVHQLNGELAWVYGRFSIQSEYTWYGLDRAQNTNPMFHGGYIYANWFLTGENRKYNRSIAAFDRIKPFENFFRVRAEDNNVYTGKGAWEVAYRCSYLKLTDAEVRGGELVDHTVGLNWYLNPYTRLMFNYIYSEADNTQLGPGTGIVNIFQMRAQIDF